MNRTNKRPGFGALRGANNPRITVGPNAPNNPQPNDLWFDTTASPGTWKYWNGSAWTT